MQISSQTEDGHDLRCSCDIKSCLPGDPGSCSAQSHNDFSERAVVHVNDPFPGNGARIQSQTIGFALDVVINDRCQ